MGNNVLTDVKEIPFGSLFNTNNSIYIIPNYQRPYAWEEKQIKDFIDDIEEAFKQDINAYLFGNIYIVPVKNLDRLKKYVHEGIINKYFKDGIDLINQNYSEVGVYLVVDGQQRITTFSILLKHLGLDNLTIPLLTGKIVIPKIILGQLDNDFFQDLVINNKNPSIRALSHKRIKIASEKISDFVKDYKNDKKFKTFVASRLSIIRSIVSGIKYAVILFVSQTDRGKELTYIEKLKSLFQFYVYIKHPDFKSTLAAHIDNTFAELLHVMEKLINSRIFNSEIEFEDYFFKILEILLKINKDTNLKEVFRISSQKAYEEINRELRNSSNPMADINILLKEIKKIINFFKYILENLSNDEYKRIFLILNPSPKSYAFLVEFHNKFPNIHFQDKKFVWKINCDLKKLLSRIGNISSRIKDLERENTELSNFLKEKLGNIKNCLDRYNVKEKQISVLDFIEFMELSLWKARKEPISNFRNSWRRAFSSSDPQGVFNAFDFVETYRCKHMFDGDVFRYIFMEYERIRNSNDSILFEILNNPKNIEVEHIFSRDPEIYKGRFRDYGFLDEADYRDFVDSSWGNRTFLEKSLNSLASNKPISDKATNYKDFCKEYKTYIKDICKLGDDLSKIDNLAKRTPTPAYRLYLEIRELDIKLFAYIRFP